MSLYFKNLFYLEITLVIAMKNMEQRSNALPNIFLCQKKENLKIVQSQALGIFHILSIMLGVMLSVTLCS